MPLACTGQKLQVQSGASACQIDANGCATTGTGQLGNGNNEQCTIRVNVAGYLTATKFDIDTGYEVGVTISGSKTPYQGRNGPRNVAVAAGATFHWNSFARSVTNGWTICWAPDGALRCFDPSLS